MTGKDDELVLLERAKVAEVEYNWTEAVKLYEQANAYFLKKELVEESAKTYKKLGYAYVRAAEAANTSEDFINYSQSATVAYQNAALFFQKVGDESQKLECKAESIYHKSYTARSPKEVRESYNKSYELFIKAKESFSKKRNQIGVLRNLSLAALALGFLTNHTSDNEKNKKLIQNNKELVSMVENSTEKFKNIKLIADTLMSTILTLFPETFIKDFKWDKQLKDDMKRFLLRGDDLLNNINYNHDSKFLGVIHAVLGMSFSFFGVQFVDDERHQRELIDKGIGLLEKGLGLAKKANDKPTILMSIFFIDWWAWLGGRVEYLQRRIFKDLNVFKEIGEIFKDSYNIYYWFANSFPSLYYANFAQRSFLSPEQRKIYAEKAIKHCIETLKVAFQLPGSALLYQSLTWAYSQLVLLSKKRDEREGNAQKMLYYAKLARELGERYDGGLTRASGYSSLSKAYKTLADIAENEDQRILMLTKAIENSKNHIQHAMESRTGTLTVQVRLGLLYEELGIITKESDPIIKAKETFKTIIKESFERGYYSYEAACHEYIARLEDRLGNHLASAEHYLKAANSHAQSLRTLEFKPLISRIKEKIDYVKAWNLIEVAKSYHKRENHIKSKECYEKAYKLLTNIPSYDYEAPYCFAWISQEEAEQFSKLDEHEKAIKGFEKTRKIFEDVIEKLAKSYLKIQDKVEKERINKLEKVAKIRMNHCSTRIRIEEARILGKSGEHITAAEKFAKAAVEIKQICPIFKIQREQEELEAVYYLCKAWESMELAEFYEDPKRFAEAANLFTKASEFFTNTKMKLLVSGNSAVCQALEHGIKFDKSVEIKIKDKQYSRIKIMLRKASSSYRKGGFEVQANWALATGSYFDAMWHLIRVDEEMELDKRNELLGIGSQYLKSAAELFGKNNYKKKEKEVLEYLELIEKEKKILMSALSTIKEPSISRGTTGIIAPSCPVETSLSPTLGEISNIARKSRTALIERPSMKKLKSDYKDTVKEQIELEKIESEMNIEKQKFICIVHKGSIKGAIYLCPTCETLYCNRCAQTLKDKNEKCWSCNQDIKL